MTNLSILWSLTIKVLDQEGALKQPNKYKVVLTTTECSKSSGANVKRWK